NRQAEATGHRHDGMALHVARLAHGRALPGRLSNQGQMASSAARRGLRLRRSDAKNDLSRRRAEEFGFKIYPTVADALRCGGDKLAVDAVLLIGEHGNYPVNAIGQKQYPRYELF